MTYSAKVYRKQGGAEFVVASGGLATVESGGDITVASGGRANFRGAYVRAQPTPTAKTTVITLTIAELLTRIITAVPTATGATIAYTLPTGADADAGVTMAIDDSFDWTLINSALAAADTITVTQNTGHTIIGGPIVQSLHVSTGGITGYSAAFRTRKTAADTFVTYRIG